MEEGDSTVLSYDEVTSKALKPCCTSREKSCIAIVAMYAWRITILVRDTSITLCYKMSARKASARDNFMCNTFASNGTRASVVASGSCQPSANSCDEIPKSDRVDAVMFLEYVDRRHIELQPIGLDAV
jgi:hypothetical protein